jgi:hypothetical protein
MLIVSVDWHRLMASEMDDRVVIDD